MSKEVLPCSYSFFENYSKIALSFSAPKLGLLLLRHPIHVVQTNKQAYPELTNIEIITNIYRESGVKGFYTSTSMSILKIFAAESYRGLLMIKVPKALCSYFIEPSPLLTSMIAIPIISGVDATLICPFVRISTLQTTIGKRASLKDICKKYIKVNPFKELYRGYTPLLIQTNIAWGSFLITDDLMKLFLKKHVKEISYKELAVASCVGGSIQTFLSTIPDTLRVQMQKIRSEPLTMRRTAEVLLHRHGVRSLFAAAPHRLLSNIIGYGYKSMLRHFWTSSE